MCSSSQPSAPTNQTVTQTNLPEYAKPYYLNLMKRTEAESYRPYQTYGGERIAGFTPAQEALQRQTMGLQTPEQFNAATQGATATGMLGLGAAQRGFNAAFGNTADYMSPYIQGALDPQIREANRQADYFKRNDALGSMGTGGGPSSYGGSRQLLASVERERNANQMVGDILGKGYQSAYDAAQRQQQFLGSLGMQGLGQAGMSSQLLGNLGTAEQQADIARLGYQQQVAAQPQALQQEKYDMAYQDFLRQRDYPKEQLGFYNQMLRGLPVQLASTQTTYQRPPSVGSQIAGLGAGALGLAKAANLFAEGGEVRNKETEGLAGIRLKEILG
jgi:hypothetical protein